MATRVTDEFGARANPPDANYPDGSLKNASAPGANDGSPVDERVGNDWEGTKQYLLQVTGTTPNGQPDSVSNPQIGNAIEKIANAGDSLVAGGLIYPASNDSASTVAPFNQVPAGARYLKNSGDGIYEIEPLEDGIITAIDFNAGTATIGGNPVLLNKPESLDGSSVFSDKDYASFIVAAERAKNNLRGGLVRVQSGNETYNSTLIPDDANNSERVSVSGYNKIASNINYDATGIAVNTRLRQDYSDFSLTAVGSAVNTAIAIGTINDPGQSDRSSWSRMRLNNFRNAIWLRKSIWNTFQDLELRNNICAVNLARADLQPDNSNPESPAGWNVIANGWFHNVIQMFNTYVQGNATSEAGIFGSPMCGSFIGVTTQGLQTDGTANNVLPTGEVGTGVYIQAGMDSTRNGWNNLLINHYSEETERAGKFVNQRYIGVKSAFSQGGPDGSNRANSIYDFDNSFGVIEGLVGADWFDNAINAENGSSVVINGGLIGPISGTFFNADATSEIYGRGWVDFDKNIRRLNKSGASDVTFTLDTTFPAGSRGEILLSVLRNGTAEQYGELVVSNKNSGIASIILWRGLYQMDGVTLNPPPSNVTATISNGGVVQIIVSGTTLTVDISATVIVTSEDGVTNQVTEIAGV